VPGVTAAPPLTDGVAEVSREQHNHSGPFPPPEVLERYDVIVPGAARRILTLAEEQTRHRIRLEKRAVWRSFCGLVAGLVVSAGCVGGGVFLVYRGHDYAGGAIATAAVLSLATVFLHGTRKSHTRVTAAAK
jgi:uncharacterized membrane protein